MESPTVEEVVEMLDRFIRYELSKLGHDGEVWDVPAAEFHMARDAATERVRHLAGPLAWGRYRSESAWLYRKAQTARARSPKYQDRVLKRYGWTRRTPARSSTSPGPDPGRTT